MGVRFAQVCPFGIQRQNRAADLRTWSAAGRDVGQAASRDFGHDDSVTSPAEGDPPGNHTRELFQAADLCRFGLVLQLDEGGLRCLFEMVHHGSFGGGRIPLFDGV